MTRPLTMPLPLSLPLSEEEFDRLGGRLRDGAPGPNDPVALRAALGAYDLALARAQDLLAAAGVTTSTARLKSEPSLVDKLRREPGLTLSAMPDLAGARVVVGDRDEQDQVVSRLVPALAGAGRPPEVDDRRGRRGDPGVTLTARIGGLPVEIQVRTELQDLWAQVTERLSDAWGRAVRLGGDPVEPDRPVPGLRDASRREVVGRLMRLAEEIGVVEELRQGVGRVAAVVGSRFPGALADEAARLQRGPRSALRMLDRAAGRELDGVSR